MICEKCNKKVEAKDIKFSPLEEYAKHKRCGGRIIKEQIFKSGNSEVYI
jgi:NAD-dependent SIR2 family protein deacetylase